MLSRLKNSPLFWILFTSLVARSAAAFFNVGFVAIDDYVYMLKLAFPAQSVPSFAKIIESSWVHPTIPMILLASLSQLPLILGFEDPLNQIQFVYFLMGVLSLITVWSAYKVFELLNRPKEAVIAGLLVGFHGIMPFFSTRVLFETFALAPLTLSLYFFVSYWQKTHSKTWNLFLSILFISLASLVRYQVGVCYFVMAYFVLFKKNENPKKFIFLLFSFLALVGTGLLDLLIDRTFHQSLFDYFKYNIYHSSDYGRSPPWNFVLFFLAFSLFPFFLKSWKDFQWKKQYAQLGIPLGFFLVFLITHSIVPHKEDRFMIPILPTFLILLTPLVNQLFVEQRFLRLKIFAGLHILILVLSSGFTAQWNTIGTARFLQKNQQFDRLLNYHDSLVFMPTAYMNQPQLKIENTTSKSLNSDFGSQFACNTLIAVREDKLPLFPQKEWSKQGSASPGPLEWLVVQLNPKRNGRRASIHLYTHPKCSRLDI